MSIIRIPRWIQNLDVGRKQLLVARLHFRRSHSEGKLNACRIGKGCTVIRTSPFSKGEEGCTDFHFHPFAIISMNLKTHDLLIKGFHGFYSFTQKDHVIEISNLLQCLCRHGQTVNNESTASANSLKLLTFNTLLHSGAYLGISLSPCQR